MPHVEIYADESGGLHDDLQSVCLLAGSSDELHTLSNMLANILQDQSITELKYTNANNKRMFATSLQALELVFDFVRQGRVYIWSKALQGATPQRVEATYLEGLQWIGTQVHEDRYSFLPDENTAINRDQLSAEWSQAVEIEDLRQVDSTTEPLIQICDLVAGCLRRSLVDQDADPTNKDKLLEYLSDLSGSQFSRSQPGLRLSS